VTSRSQARRLFEATLGNPKLYDYAQRRLSGLSELRSRVGRNSGDFRGRVLDIGAGTGNFADVFPADAQYVATDADPAKIERFRMKYPQSEAHVVDGTRLPFEDGSCEHSVCIDVSHHLTDHELERLLAEAARVTRKSFLFVDALWVHNSLVSKALWSVDRGRHPRPRAEVISAIARHFHIEHTEDFRLTHTYLLVRARPSDGQER